MARQIALTDDMDGSPDAQTITFSFDGQKYEIDLSHENQEKFRQALAPYLAKSRLVESPPSAPDAVGSMLGRLRRSRATRQERPRTGGRRLGGGHGDRG
jgi:hypothetical protein